MPSPTQPHKNIIQKEFHKIAGNNMAGRSVSKSLKEPTRKGHPSPLRHTLKEINPCGDHILEKFPRKDNNLRGGSNIQDKRKNSTNLERKISLLQS